MSCDLTLIVGIFIHGLGNYERMRNDKEIPFCIITAQFIIADSGSAQSFRSFRVGKRVAKKLSDDALSEAKCKAQDESYEAIAAAAAASKLVADKGYMIY